MILALSGGGGVEVTDGDGQGVGGIGGFGNLIEVEEARDHLLDLMFFGAPVSDDGGLDGEWRIFGDFESSGSGGEHGHSADLAKFQCGLHIGGIEDVFNGDAVGAVADDELLQADGNGRQPRGHGIARGNLDGSANDADQLIVVTIVGEQIDHAVAGVFRAAVDAEDAHGGSVAGELGAMSSQLCAFSYQFW